MNSWTKIGLGIGCLWLAAKIAMRNLVVGVQKVTLRSIDVNAGTTSVNLYLTIQNPLPFGVRLNKLVGDLYAQGTKVGYINTQFDYLLGGERTHAIPVVVNLSFEGVTRALWDNIQTGNVSTLKIDFNGSLYVTKANIAVPLDLTFDWKDIVG